MTQQRPDLLPFALPKRIGLDKHGLVTAGKLSGVDYPVTAGCGEVRAVAGQTTTTGTNGFQNYALLSGDPPNIGGHELYRADFIVEEWIYSDAKHSWIVRSTLSHNYSTHYLTLTLTLEKSFGVLGMTVAVTPRTLATLTWRPTTYAGTALVLKSGSTFYYHGYLLTHCLDGSIAFLNVGRKSPSPLALGIAWDKTVVGNACPGDPTFAFHDVVKVLITGDGDLDNNGIGIVASIVIDVPATSMKIAETTTGSATTRPWVSGFGSYEIDNIEYSNGYDPEDVIPTTYYEHTIDGNLHWADTGTGSNSKTYDDTATTVEYLFGKAVLPDKTIKNLTILKTTQRAFVLTAELDGGTTGFESRFEVPDYNLVITDVIYCYPTGGLLGSSGEETKTVTAGVTLNIGSPAIELVASTYAKASDSHTGLGWVEGDYNPNCILYSNPDLSLNLSPAIISNIQDGRDYAPSSLILESFVIYHSGNIFGIWKRMPDWVDYYEFAAIDGSTYDIGTGLPSGHTLTYDPIKKQWGTGSGAVFV
jgi:hypothetical protein